MYSKDFDIIMNTKTSLNRENILMTFLYIKSKRRRKLNYERFLQNRNL